MKLSQRYSSFLIWMWLITGCGPAPVAIIPVGEEQSQNTEQFDSEVAGSQAGINYSLPAGQNSRKLVRLLYLIPQDKEFNQVYASALESGVIELQNWFRSQLGGKTFKLRNPIVEVFFTSHPSNWYSENPQDVEFYLWVYFNLLEGLEELGIGFRINDPNNVWIVYIDADAACGQQAAGGGSKIPYFAAQDLRGLAGADYNPMCDDSGKIYNNNYLTVGAWIGRMGHELAHSLGLAHPVDESSYPLPLLTGVGLYEFPSSVLTAEEKEKLISSGFFN